MSIFNPDVVKKSNSWAEDELYARSAQLGPDTLTPDWNTLVPAWIERKTDKKVYHTMYSLYQEYLDECELRFTREKFMDIVKKECPDIVIYKNITYYSWWWFYNNFVDVCR